MVQLPQQGSGAVLRSSALVKRSVKWTSSLREQGMENYSGCKGLCSLGRTGICWPFPHSSLKDTQSQEDVQWSQCLWGKMEKRRTQHDSSLFRNLRIYMEMGRTEKEVYKSSKCWEASESTCKWLGRREHSRITATEFKQLGSLEEMIAWK